jgi:hypothetical protein
VEIASGVHRRRFSNGIVLVNPTTVTHRVALGGRYSGDGLHRVADVLLAPHSGLILTRSRTRGKGKVKSKSSR